PTRKVIEVPQPSDPIEHATDEAVHKELRDNLVRLPLLILKQDSDNEESLGEDASKQERRIDDINANEDITLVNVQADAEMFDADKDIGGEEVFVEQEVVTDTKKIDEVT
nr:hypothetical protein [Tanacetum cinerariifolium]